MRIAAALLIAGVSFGAARCARHAAATGREEALAVPYTPSPATAPFVALGYREAFADLLFVRLRGYFGSYYDTTGDAVASLTEAIVALDPQFRRVYEFGANAMTIAEKGVDQSIVLRAIAILERGAAEFPSDWSIPMLAGQMYIQDLKTTDAEQRRVWDDRGAALVESAIRKPRAPQSAAVWAANIRTKLGQHERAAQGLRELLLVTTDTRLREALLKRLAEIEQADSAELAAEVLGARQRFERAWKAERPLVNPSLYILIGARSQPGWDPADLATGGRDLFLSEPDEKLEPLE